MIHNLSRFAGPKVESHLKKEKCDGKSAEVEVDAVLLSHQDSVKPGPAYGLVGLRLGAVIGSNHSPILAERTFVLPGVAAFPRPLEEPQNRGENSLPGDFGEYFGNFSIGRASGS